MQYGCSSSSAEARASGKAFAALSGFLANAEALSRGWFWHCMLRQKIETVLILVPVFQRNHWEGEVARKMTGKTQRRDTSVGMNRMACEKRGLH